MRYSRMLQLLTMIREEALPVRERLQSDRMVSAELRESTLGHLLRLSCLPMLRKLTPRSFSVNPRRSWVRWVLKHPVTKARAASLPAKML